MKKESYINEKKIYPLTSTQMDIWNDQKLFPDLPNYIIGGYGIVNGNFNIDIFSKALKITTDENESLRLKFTEIENIPYQYVEVNCEPDLKILDYTNFTEPEKQAIDFIEKEFYVIFDLVNNLLFKTYIIKLSENRNIMFYKFHHLINDGFGIMKFYSKLSENYNKILKNEKIEISKNEYVSFIKENLEYLQSEKIKIDAEYWNEKFKILPEPLFKETAADNTQESIIKTIRLEREKYEQLNIIARNSKTGFFHLFIGMLWLYLSRIYQEEDIVFSLSLLNREKKQYKETTGLFTSVIPFRLKADSSENFLTLTGKIRDEIFTDYKYRNYPYSRINNIISSKTGRMNDIFQVTLSYEISKMDILFGDCKIIYFPMANKYEMFGLNIYVREYQKEDKLNNDIIIDIGGKKSFFSEYELERIAGDLNNLINEIISNPDRKINEFELISATEKEKILYEFNATDADYPKEKTIAELFEEQVEKTPDNIAVVFENKKITYSELNEKANVIARYLVGTEKLKTEDIVALHLERSEYMIIAILGIFKAGCAYLPIDIDMPEERINYILNDSNAVLTFSDTGESEYLDIRKIIGICGTGNLNLKIFNDNLAYIIYTSGSTGQPKGVMIEQKGMINHLFAKINSLKLTSDSIVAVNAAYHFDISVWQFLANLLVGGRIVIYSKNVILNIEKFINKIVEDKISILEVVPAYLTEMLVFFNEKQIQLNSLKYLIVTGESLKQNLVKLWFEKYPEILMVNAYGPTEASDDITHFFIDKSFNMDRIPVGKPVSNLKIYIVDKNMKLCPVGVQGEIVVSGVGVGRGYINNKEKTEEVFIKDCILSETGNRMYKTGDIGRWLPDGNIEFLGRIDEQEKIRGFRIELGEIETAISKHPAIKENVVIAKKLKGENENKELIAYYTLKINGLADNENSDDSENLRISKSENFKLGISEIREFLEKFLPEYMIPSYFVELERMPLNQNGKIDKKKLPLLSEEDLVAGRKYKEPETQIEKKLAEIWNEVLMLTKVSVLDNFFELGGQSIKAIQVVSRIQKSINAGIGIKEIFQYPTIKELANCISNSKKIELFDIKKVEENEYYELSNAQRRLWVLSQFEEQKNAYNMPAVLEIEGNLNIECFRNSIFEVIDRHEILRTIFVMINGEPKQKIIETDKLKIENYFEYEDISKTDNSESIILNCQSSILNYQFDLTKVPMMKIKIIKICDYKFLLFFNMHHIISDGWSMNILIKDIMEIYNSKIEKRESGLTKLNIQYKDYAYWQNKLLKSEKINYAREYWLKKLSGEIPALELPSDKPRPVVQTFNGDMIDGFIEKEITGKINELCKKQNVSLFMFLTAAVKVLLHFYTGAEDIIIGSPIAGRIHSDLENQIGFYVNSLALRDNIKSEMTFAEFLDAVRNTALEAYQN
ncbi:amino acid adenylation domain-containing protein, partial [Candidatus Dependentiae bacterium]|nr:amino acid adenylation domain-containing protein [Candidatus Dependentiae bacterium]